jgi:hypothetical protein
VDTAAIIPLRPPGTAGDADVDAISESTTIALAEIDAAIALVVGGAARRVRLTAVPFAESAAATGLARAQAAGVAFAVERAERIGVTTLTIGPRT